MFSSVRVLVAVALTGQNHHCWRNPGVCSWSCHVKNPKCQLLMLVKVALSCRCIIFAGKIMFFFLLTQPRFFIVKSSFPGVKPARVILESNSFPHFPLQNPHVSHTEIPILGDLLVWNPRFCHIPSISQDFPAAPAIPSPGSRTRRRQGSSLPPQPVWMIVLGEEWVIGN